MDELHERGIFQSQMMSSSLIVLNSTLSVFGSDSNHDAIICCLSRMSEDDNFLEMCYTTLYVYYCKFSSPVCTQQGRYNDCCS